MKGLYENVTSAVHPEDTVTELDYWIILEKWIMKNMSAAPASFFFPFFFFSFFLCCAHRLTEEALSQS